MPLAVYRSLSWLDVSVAFLPQTTGVTRHSSGFESGNIKTVSRLSPVELLKIYILIAELGFLQAVSV